MNFAAIRSLAGPAPDCGSEAALCDLPVGDFPRFEFNMGEVKRAGQVIASDLIWDETTEAEIREAFKIAKLMSAEFAVAEECPEPQGVPSRDKRIFEIQELDRSLNAIGVLDNMSHVVRWTDFAPAPSPHAKPTHYLIKYNTGTKQVEVRPEFGAEMAIREYNQAEFPDNKGGQNSTNVVLVELDKVENLKAAYPNYFGDVQLFKEQLKRIVKGMTAEEYTVRPQETVALRSSERPDLAWFKKRIRWR